MNVSRETEQDQLSHALRLILRSDPVLALVRCSSAGKQLALKGLTDSALFLVLASLIHKSESRISIQITEVALADGIYRGIYNLIKDRVYLFPVLGVDDTHIPGFEIESERYFSEAHQALIANLPGLYITSAAALETPVDNKKTFEIESLILRLDDTIKREFLVERLVKWGYEQVDHTVTPKTFSVRGGIVDIYLLYAIHPIRVEFFGDRVESIRLYDPITQRSIGNREKVEIKPPPCLPDEKDQPLLKSLFTADFSRFYITEEKDRLFTLETHFRSQEFWELNIQPLDISKLPDKSKIGVLEALLKEYSQDKLFFFSLRSLSLEFINKHFKPVYGVIPSAFHSQSLGLVCLATKSVTGIRPAHRYRWAVERAHIKHEKLSNLHSLSWGDYLVHQDFGVGLYRGLEKVGPTNALQENIKIEYADGGTVFVPVDRFGRVHKYIGVGDSNPPLDSLGSTKWERQKATARRSASEIVDELIALYKARTQPRGYVYTKDTELLNALADSFPFEATPDQATAIRDVLSDMDKSKPMDRLVYGDVGFGKTEVALRATMKAVASGKVVFFLTPTTILADQHYITCKNRLDPLGVRVELLSRFRSKKEQAAIIEKLHTNHVDVIVGTHRILSEDVFISNLGLLIVDEEHRFGVKHKDAIRRLKTKVDVLTLTATPIPRTLQQSMIGVRDLSKIDTPPKERLPISTWVKYFRWSHIYNTLRAELRRDGQVYFLHNDINSMPFYFDKIQDSFPEYRVAMAHGRMSSRDLEKTILSFFNGDIDILVCTTIVESGLDVTNANTIIINNAHRFGLTQLYQIRGRVGRSYRQAYCYLLIPAGKTLSAEAYQRLKAVEHFSALGSGYDIALKDLEIRGAGNLFGYEQSGKIARVGFELYSKILKEAVDKVLGNQESSPSEKTVLVFSGHALIPREYVPLVQDRLYFYQRLSEAEKVETVHDISQEFSDRFGPPPQETINLIKITKIKKQFMALSISRVSLTSKETTIVLRQAPKGLDMPTFLSKMQSALNADPIPYKISTDRVGSLIFQFSTKSLMESTLQADQFAQLFSRVASG